MKIGKFSDLEKILNQILLFLTNEKQYFGQQIPLDWSLVTFDVFQLFICLCFQPINTGFCTL